jgi:protein involved in polysaccharide export with SLBB domain
MDGPARLDVIPCATVSCDNVSQASESRPGGLVSRTTIASVVILSAMTLACSSGVLKVQQPELDPRSAPATRQRLEELRLHYDAAERSLAYSEELRALARARADAVRQRLGEGDFRAGDLVVMAVEGEPALSDTFLASNNRALDLPNVGTVSLRGVLRSELETHLTDHIGQYINDPVVHARSFMRISITGEVVRPGFYLVPPETPIGDVIMLAGGPTPPAKLSRIRINRGSERIWENEALQLAIRDGQTLAELNVQNGDEVDVPRRSAFAPGEIGNTLLVVSGVVVTFAYLFQR